MLLQALSSALKSANLPQIDATAEAELASQIRSTYKDSDWNVRGADRSLALAKILRSHGVTDLSQLKMGAGLTTTSEGSTDESGRYSEPVTATRRQLLYGDTPIGFGAKGAKGAEPYLKDMSPVSDAIGQDTSGHGKVVFQAVEGPDGRVSIKPVWQSTSDAKDVRNILKGVAGVAGAAYGLPALLGPGGLATGGTLAGGLASSGLPGTAGLAAGTAGAAGAAAPDAIGSYLTTGGAEGSIIGGGTGGGAGAVGGGAASAALGGTQVPYEAAYDFPYGGNLPTAAANGVPAVTAKTVADAVSKYGLPTAKLLAQAGALGAGALAAVNTISNMGEGPPSSASAGALPDMAQINTTVPTTASNPGIAAAQQNAAGIAQKQLGEVEAQKALAAGEIANLRPLVAQGVAGMGESADRAGATGGVAFGDYLTSRPAYDKMVEQAMTLDSPQALQAAGGRAAVDAQRAIGNALRAQQRSMAGMGINPATTPAVGRSDAIRMAAERAAAAEMAKRSVESRADTLRGNVAQIGQQAAGLGLNAGQVSDAARANAVSLGTTPLSLTRAASGDYLSGTGAAGASNQQAANIGLTSLGVDQDAAKTTAALTGMNNQFALDRARLGEISRQADQDAALRQWVAQRGASNQDWAGVGATAKYALENWDKIGTAADDIWSKIGTLFGGKP